MTLPYSLTYILGLAVQAALVILVGILKPDNPLGLNPQIIWAIGLLITILRAGFPSILHTPNARETELLKAHVGILPRDLKHKEDPPV